MILGTVNVPDFIATVVRSVVRELGGFEWLTMGLVYAESGFDPNAYGDFASNDPRYPETAGVSPLLVATGRDSAGQFIYAWYCSGGLLQLNVCGGQGTGRNDQVFDPWLNIQIGQPYISVAMLYAQQQGWQGEQFIREVARRSGHPGFVELDDPRLDTIVAKTLALILDANGDLAPWPAFDPSLATDEQPFNPLVGFWSEPFDPGDDATNDQLVTLHEIRIEELIDGSAVAAGR